MTGVVINHGGTQETVTADFVVAACGAANSARLLLTSASERHPNGLANGSDQVGRNYVFHNSQAVLALSMEENPTIFQKTLGLNDFYLSGSGFEFPVSNIQMVGKSQAPMFRGEAGRNQVRSEPSWSLEDVAKHAVDFWLSTEDMPRPENRVTVDKNGTITIAYQASNDVPKDRLYEQLKSMLAHLGMHHHLLPHHAYLKNEIPVAGVAHQAGTCRFGTDPETSVLDVNCKAHELDNLCVADTSFFPSIGAVNPALTAIANALRAGDRLLDRMGVSSDAARPTADTA